MRVVDIEPSDRSVGPPSPQYHFDLAPTEWPSQLLDLAENGRIDLPWASWHRDRKTLLVACLAPNNELGVASHLKRDGEGWVVTDLALGLGWSRSIQSREDLAGLDVALAECRARALAFDQMYSAIDELLDPWRQSARGAKTRRSETAYAALAARYVELVNGGERHPAQRLAEALGISASSVALRIGEARMSDMDLLSAAVNGVAGGVLTDKAKWLLVKATSTN